MKAQQLLPGIALLGTPPPSPVETSHYVAGPPILDSFVSFSIEFAYFPDFAGNKSHPNTFSETLLNNIGVAQGSQPIVRVGGNTQDYAIYNATLLDRPILGIVDPDKSPDYPTTLQIGPSFFDSYAAWSTPGLRYIHGFNMGLGGNASRPDGWQTLLDTVPLACRALGGGSGAGEDRLYLWEYGNEPDSYSQAGQGPVRPPSWNESTFVAQWLNGTRQIFRSLKEHCPDLAVKARYGFLAPSFAGTTNKLQAPLTWHSGLGEDNNVFLFSSHNYISGAASPGVTLRGTLLNHSVTVRSVDAHVAEYRATFGDRLDVPHMLGEANSLYNQGKPGLSNTFGAALWGVDFNLYCASVGIRRVHMHLGTDYRYGSWQPVGTNRTAVGTKAPYYGNMAVAAMLSKVGLAPSQSIRVAAIRLPGADDHESAYIVLTTTAADDGDDDGDEDVVGDRETKIIRIVIINMNAYNSTRGGEGVEPIPAPELPYRGFRRYSFYIPGAGGDSDSDDDDHAAARGEYKVRIQRLLANGSDAITGITWDGLSYERELDGGRPVRLPNSRFGEDAGGVEVATVLSGAFTVTVPDSSAAMVVLPPDADWGSSISVISEQGEERLESL